MVLLRQLKDGKLHLAGGKASSDTPSPYRVFSCCRTLSNLVVIRGVSSIRVKQALGYNLHSYKGN